MEETGSVLFYLIELPYWNFMTAAALVLTDWNLVKMAGVGCGGI